MANTSKTLLKSAQTHDARLLTFIANIVIKWDMTMTCYLISSSKVLCLAMFSNWLHCVCNKLQHMQGVPSNPPVAYSDGREDHEWNFNFTWVKKVLVNYWVSRLHEVIQWVRYTHTYIQGPSWLGNCVHNIIKSIISLTLM